MACKIASVTLTDSDFFIMSRSPAHLETGFGVTKTPKMLPIETNVQKLARERQEKELELSKEKQMFSYDNLAQSTGYNKEMLIVVHKSVAKNTSPAEFAYFLQVSKSVGLSPVNKEIWCYKDGSGNLIVFTGRDGFLKKNKEMQSYLGMRSSDVCEFDDFEIDMIEGTVKHKITTNRGKVILGAYAIVSHEGKKDTIVWLDFDEFNLNQAKWKTSPKMMIKKCAQSHALKEACGMSGVQAAEAFDVKDGLASTKTDDIEHEEINKEDERLEIMIAQCESMSQLEKLKRECITPHHIALWDKRKNELESK